MTTKHKPDQELLRYAVTSTGDKDQVVLHTRNMRSYGKAYPDCLLYEVTYLEAGTRPSEFQACGTENLLDFDEALKRFGERVLMAEKGILYDPMRLGSIDALAEEVRSREAAEAAPAMAR